MVATYFCYKLVWLRLTRWCFYRPPNLKGKVAIVTGATSGIGLGIAKCLAKQGCNLVISGSRGAEEAKETVELLIETGVKVVYCQADLVQPEVAVKAIFKTLEGSCGFLHILDNNAGVGFISPVESFPLEEWNRVLSINLTSAFLLTQAAIPLMRKNEGQWGRIINISSVHGVVASVHKAAYVSSKHALNGFTKVTALELAADTQITCNAICPGWVHTPLVQKQIETRSKNKNLSMEDATADLLAEKQPSKKFTTVTQIGDMVVFLCSDSASNLTGALQIMDGGWTTQ